MNRNHTLLNPEKFAVSLLTFIVFIGLLSCNKEKIENKKVISKYDNGQLMQEQVKYKDNDTIVEFTYFMTGQLNQKRQLLDGQRTGWSFIYNKKGTLLFSENYLDDNLSGELKAFYPTGQVSRIENYRKNIRIDSTTYFDKNGKIEKKVVFLTPCDISSCECNQLVTIYENGSKIYSYEVSNGIKSVDQTVYDQKVYEKLLSKNEEEPLSEKGKSLFRNNCGTCHKVKNQPVGPALNSFSKTISSDELFEILIGSKGHPVGKISQEETEALIDYINKNCS